MARPRTRRRERRSVPQGRAYIYSTFNNTLVSLTDPQGNVIATASAGTVGFKGSRKGTAFAAQRAAEQVARKGMDSGLRQIDVFIKGPGAGREAAIRSLQGAGLFVTSIRDVTPIPHNGCRPPKRRRVYLQSHGKIYRALLPTLSAVWRKIIPEGRQVLYAPVCL